MTEITKDFQLKKSNSCVLLDWLLKFYMQKNPPDSFLKA